MVIDPAVVKQGLDAGYARIEKALGVQRAQLGFVDSKIRDVLASWPLQLSDRFVVLFSELVMVAAAARVKYKEPQLREDEIRAYLAHSAFFLNSWGHF